MTRMLALRSTLLVVALSGNAMANVPGLVLAGNSACRVTLTKVSYDTPGADASEFVELHADPVGMRLAIPDRHPLDAGADASDASALDAGAPTLGDCGLSALALVDGSGDACNIYRTIPLAVTPIPADGYIVLCANGTAFDLASHCDVTYAGRSALKNGWLQNGPNDGLRFETGSGNVDVGYEGAPSCFSTSAAELVTETGEVSSGMGATEDDVNAFCAGRFQLLPASEATLRSIPDCPTPPIGGGARDASPESSGDATMVVERIPDTGSGGAPALYESGWFDAAVLGTPDPLPGPPSPPGCAIGHEVGSGASPLTATLVTLGFASLMLRRRRTLLPVSGSPIVRAARSGSSPRR